MAESAALQPTVQSQPYDGAASRVRHAVAWRLVLPARLQVAWRRALDRVRAKWIYHDSRRYREWVARVTAAHADARCDGLSIATLRRLDPAGLGIYYLAPIAHAPRLVDLCRRAFLAPRNGLPRPVAHLLSQQLDGKSVCPFLDPAGLDAVASETLIAAALGLVLSAGELDRHADHPPWTEVQGSLTSAANAMQTAVTAHHRALPRSLPSGGRAAVNLAYQAVNVVRRALNRTELLADDERLAASAKRLARQAAHAACSAANELIGGTTPPTRLPGERAARDKLLALGRTVDALAARASDPKHPESPSSNVESLEMEQSARVLAAASAVVRPWGVHVSLDPVLTRCSDSGRLCQLACMLAGASAEVLDACATLHQLCQSPVSPDRVAGRNNPPRPDTPLWVTRLVDTVAGRWTSADVLESVRTLAHTDRPALAAAVVISVLPRGSRTLRRALWELIRAVDSSPAERSLAFQLFCRLSPRSASPAAGWPV